MRLIYYIIFIAYSKLVHAKELLSTETLFGPIWQFTEYCGTYQVSKRLVQDDEISESVLNGSRFDELSNGIDRIRIKKLIYESIVAKNSLSLVCSVNSWSYADDGTRNLANPTAENSIDCECQLNRLLKSLSPRNSRELPGECTAWVNEHDSFNQINSFGRLTDGSLYFNDMWLGDYDKCAAMKQMRYCFGSFKTPDWLSSDLQRDDFRGFKIGLCLPRTCGNESLQNRVILSKIKSLAQENLVCSFNLTGEFVLDDIYCPPTTDSKWMSLTKDPMSIFLLLVVLIWSVLLIHASFFRASESVYTTLEVFDVQRNLGSFFSGHRSDSLLPGINSIKVIAMIWLVCSHSMIGLMPFVRNYPDVKSDSLIAGIILQGHHAVPIFFLISGLLVGLKHLYKKQDNTRLIAHRYLRLAPMYIVMYAYVKKFSHLMSSGPVWDYGVSPQSEARQCMLESWFIPILMLGNFVNPFSHCILTGWHISNDFQIYLILPLIFYLYRKSELIGRMSVFIGFVISHAHHHWVYLTSGRFNSRQLLSNSFYFGPRIVIERLAFDYVNPIGRIGNYLLGVLVADLLLQQISRSERQEGQDYRKIDNWSETDYPRNSKAADCLGEHEAGDGLDLKRHSSVNQLWQSIKSNKSLSTGLFLLMYALSFPAAPESVKKAHYASSLKDLMFPTSRVIIEVGYFLTFHHIVIHGRRKCESSKAADTLRAKSANQSKLSCDPIGTFNKPKRLVEEFKNVQQPSCTRLLFTASIWDILVKLNYSIILTHYTVVRYVVQSQRQLLIYNAINSSKTLVFIMALCYLVSFIIHICVEMPLTHLIKKLVSKIDKQYK